VFFGNCIVAIVVYYSTLIVNKIVMHVLMFHLMFGYFLAIMYFVNENMLIW